MPRNPNKIKTSLFKAVQKQALLWSDGDLIIWGHQECTALHWLNPCHSAQSWKNWTFSLGKQGPAPQLHHLLCLLCQAAFFMRSLLLEEWAAMPVCVCRGSVYLQHCKQPQHTGVAVSCTKHSHQLPVCPNLVFHIRAASGSHCQPQKDKRDMVKTSFNFENGGASLLVNYSHEQPFPKSLHSFIYILRKWLHVSNGITGTSSL